MVSTLDLAATLVALSGATAGRVMDGRSLVPLFAGDAAWRTALLVEGDDVLPGQSDTVYGYYSGVRTADYKYAEHVNRQEAYLSNEFYDLTADPYEVDSRPRDPRYRQIVAQLKPMLASLRTCSGDSCWIDSAAPRPLPVPKVKPQIGPLCGGRCVHLNVRRSLEPAESSDIR
jgi:arylsulfatase A-like enzyme